MTESMNRFRNYVSLASLLVTNANHYILTELKRHGVMDLQPAHGDIFSVLFTQDDLTVTEIAQRTQRTKSTASVLIDKLTQLGYLTKETSNMDTRAVSVRLTPKGHALKETFVEISAGLNEKMLSDLTDEEADQLSVLLAKVAVAVGK